MSGDDHLTRLVCELCDLLLAVIRFPHSALPPAGPAAPAAPAARTARVAARRQGVPAQMSPAGFASLLLGASLALMLCGSVTFMIGFMLMPWVIGLVVLLYFVGMVSNLSGLWRAILCPSSGPSSPKEISVSGWKFLLEIFLGQHLKYNRDYHEVHCLPNFQ